jgi:hypothetical protein
MKKRIRYSDEPLGKLKVIDDFLPSPEQLVLREDKVKITIALSRSSIRFFKEAAKENKTQYQKMIRGVLDYYASRFNKPPNPRLHPTDAKKHAPIG